MPRRHDELSDGTLRLLLARGVGPVSVARLVRHFGSHDGAAAASAADFAGVEGISRAAAGALRRALDQTDPASERLAMSRRGARMILPGDDDYPPLLAAIEDPPAALWIRGTLEATDRMAMAVVGSRRCSVYGRGEAGRFAALLAGCGLTIVSGGAVGIDAAAHRGALRAGGRTIAVMGCGLGRCYPPAHADLFERIASGAGAVLSDLPMAAEPRPGHFPRRNRIIAGLSLGVLVVEAARHSGALITARLAGAQGREVMAVPGRVDSPASAGCLAAIREGWAALVRGHLDVLEQLDGASHLVRGAMERAGAAAACDGERAVFEGALSESQARLVAALRSGGVAGPDELSARTGLAVGRILAELTLLRIRGLVRRDGAGYRSVR